MNDSKTNNSEELLYPWQKKATNDLAIQNLNDSKMEIYDKFTPSEYELESTNRNVNIKDGKMATSIKHEFEVKKDIEDEYVTLKENQNNKEISDDLNRILESDRKKEIFIMFLDSAENNFEDGREFNENEITLLIDYIDEHSEVLNEQELEIIASIDMNELKDSIGEKVDVLDNLLNELEIDRPEENMIKEAPKDEAVIRKYPLPKPSPNNF